MRALKHPDPWMAPMRRRSCARVAWDLAILGLAVVLVPAVVAQAAFRALRTALR